MAIDQSQLRELIKRCQKSPIFFINTFCMISHPKAGIIPFKLFDYQKVSIRAFLKHRFNIYRKCRQCFEAGSMVWTPIGPVPIENIKEGDDVYSVDDNNNIIISKVADTFDNGVSEDLVEVRSKTGHRAICTSDHEYKTYSGWVEASDLTQNDRLVEVYDNPRYGSATESDAILLGYLITDGSYGRWVNFTNSTWRYLLEFQKHFEVKFGKRLKIRKHDSSFKPDGKNYRMQTNLTACRDWLKNIGINGDTGKAKKIPQVVFGWDNKYIALLINRMFAGDGWYSGGNCNEAGIAQESVVVLHQLKQLLTRFQISSKFYPATESSLPKLRIMGGDDFDKFVKYIGIYGKEPRQEITRGFFFNRDKGETKSVKPIDGARRVYDLKVPPYDNYIVDGAAVHNCGISTLCGAFALWYAMFFNNKTILIVSKRDKDAKDFLTKNVKLLYANLPGWMKAIWKLSVDNEHEFGFTNGSKITSLTSSPETLRSHASSLNIVDEAAFMPHMDDMWAGGYSTLQHGGSVIVISTSKGVGNWYWRFWTDAEIGVNDFNPIIINWWDMTWKIQYRDELSNKKIVIAPTAGLRKCKNAKERDTYGPYWSPWVEQERRNLTEKGDDTKFRQEVLAEFIGTGDTVLSRQTIAKIGDDVDKDYKTVGEEDYVNPITGERERLNFDNELWVWEKPKVDEIEDPNNPGKMIKVPHLYIMGCDTATGEADDFSALSVVDMTTFEQVAELKIKVRPKIFAKMIDYVGRYYNNAAAVVENTGIGKATCQELYEDLSYPNMYRSRRKRADLKFKMGVLGFSTTGQSKPLIDKALIDGLGHGDGTIVTKSSRLYKEAMIYVRLTNNKTGAEPGKGNNDDLIIAIGLALVGAPDIIRISGQTLMPYHNSSAPMVQPSLVDRDSVLAEHSRLAKIGGRDLLLPMLNNSETRMPGGHKIAEEIAKFTSQLGGITMDSKGVRTKRKISTVKVQKHSLIVPKKKR